MLSHSTLYLPIAPFTFFAHPFIKHWLPYLIWILLISCCQLILMIPFHFISSLFPSLSLTLTSSLIYLSYHLIILPVWIFSSPDHILPHGKLSCSTPNEGTGLMPCPSRSQLAAMLGPVVPSHLSACMVIDRRREQIRHQKMRFRGSIHFPRLSPHRLCRCCDRWSASNCNGGPQRGH